MIQYKIELKVRQFQNEFMKSSVLPKYVQKIVEISALTTQGRNPDNFSSYFGRNDDFTNLFWNLLTFRLPHIDWFRNYCISWHKNIVDNPAKEIGKKCLGLSVPISRFFFVSKTPCKAFHPH